MARETDMQVARRQWAREKPNSCIKWMSGTSDSGSNEKHLFHLLCQLESHPT